MKKILNNKDLLEQFKRDKEVMSQKQLAEKYSISLSSITRLVNQIKQQSSSNQSQISEHSEQSQSQSQSQNSNEEQDSQNDQSESIHEQSNEEQPSSESIHEQSNENISSPKNIQSSKSIEEIQQEENLIDKSLINYLNKPNDSLEILRNKKEKIDQPIIKPQVIQQPQPIIIQQPVQQIDLQQNLDDESEIKNYMVKIRKFIQFFSKEDSIHHIIGSTEFQQRQFISRLYLKNLEELKLIHKSIEFELLFSRSNTFVQDSIESGALFIERLLLTIDVNVVGVYQEMQKDEEFQFYMNMYLCESSYVASAKQILFLKFIKNYYKKYSENKSNTSIDFKQKLKEQANKDLLERFNRL